MHSIFIAQKNVACIISKEGLQFSVEHSNSTTIHAYLQQSLCNDYQFNPETENGNATQDDQVPIAFNLTSMLECLSMFGNGVEKEGIPSSSSGGSGGGSGGFGNDHGRSTNPRYVQDFGGPSRIVKMAIMNSSSNLELM